LNVGDPTSALKDTVDNIGVLTCANVYRDGQNLNEYETHCKDYAKRKDHKSQTFKHVFQHIHGFFSSVYFKILYIAVLQPKRARPKSQSAQFWLKTASENRLAPLVNR
jgi:hypothetical protein